MEVGASSEPQEKPDMGKGRPKPGSKASNIGPFVPRTDHNPRELISWAKKTGFNPKFSGEAVTGSFSERESIEKRNASNAGLDLEKGFEVDGGGGSSPKIEIDPILGRTRENRGSDFESVRSKNGGDANFGLKDERVDVQKKIWVEPVVESERNVCVNENGIQTEEPNKEFNKDEQEVHIDGFSENYEPEFGEPHRSSGMRCGLRENPGFEI